MLNKKFLENYYGKFVNVQIQALQKRTEPGNCSEPSPFHFSQFIYPAFG